VSNALAPDLSPILPLSLSPLLRFPRARLLAWYRRHARDLPWRRTRDPYAIWVSEVMLQQTQVATVVPYFERFLAGLPTLASLAAVPLSQVLRLWEGLGYYRRARHLHAAARSMMKAHAGQLPDDPAELGSLPGFGRYTVGAVLSQAYGRPLAIVEANSRRVLSRYFGLGENAPRMKTERAIWAVAEALVPKHVPGEFNQALMELGALVCTPRGPDCSSCPLHAGCRARRSGLQASLPVTAARGAVERIQEVAVVPVRRGKVLVLKRGQAERWAGLWEFPHGPLRARESTTKAAVRILRELTGLKAKPRAAHTNIRYSVTRFRYDMECFVAESNRDKVALASHVSGRWLTEADLKSLPMSAPQRRLAEWLVLKKRGQDF
jgi:A/G-specific adenine glycosylase